MATNKTRWLRNLDGASEPLTMLHLFQAGATQAIKAGEILELTGDTNTAWVPIDSDFAMNGNIAVAAEEIKAGDRAGYYNIIVPRPGDVFEFPLATAAATAIGTALYFSDSETVTNSGTNALGYAVGTSHYPLKQGHLADDAGGDAGTTIKSYAYVEMVFALTASFYAALVRSDRTANIGDAGGYAGLIFDATGTSIQAQIDATLTHSLEADGTVTDEVS